MQTLRRTPIHSSLFWFWIVMPLGLIILDENLINWLLAVLVGHKSVINGFRLAFAFFTWNEYLFALILRAFPYFLLTVVVLILLFRHKRAASGIAWGGFVGIAAYMTYETILVYLPFYNGQHISSTFGLAFLVFPIIAIFPGVVGALIGWGVSIAYRD